MNKYLFQICFNLNYFLNYIIDIYIYIKMNRERSQDRYTNSDAKNIEQQLGYTSVSNPYGDRNLSQKFDGWGSDYHKKNNNKNYLEDIKYAKEQRIQETQRMEDFKQKMLFEREKQHFEIIKQKEEKILQDQVKQRPLLRIEQKRETSVDIFFRINQCYQGNHQYYINDLENNMKDIKGYIKQQNLEQLQLIENELKIVLMDNYWGSINRLVKLRVQKLKENQNKGVLNEYKESVQEILNEKNTVQELLELEAEIQNNLEDQTMAMDTDFYDQIRKYLTKKVSILNLHNIFQVYEKKNLQNAKQFYQDSIKDQPIQDTEKAKRDQQKIIPQRQKTQVCYKGEIDYQMADIMKNMEKVEDNPDIPKNIARAIQYEKTKPLAENHYPFKAEVISQYMKNYGSEFIVPEYTATQIQGFHWNKYNIMHYDKDNLPPTFVQGYHFNIYYPYIKNVKKAPQYFIEPSEIEDHCVIRFQAPEKYHDISFRIVNGD